MGKRGRPPYPDILTPREFEVLGLLRQGLSNPEIAERLGISRDGAKYHVSEILTKLGLSSRDEAALASASGGRERPWWAAALAPVGSLWRRAGSVVPPKVSTVALALSGALVVVLLAGAALTAYLLLREADEAAPPPTSADGGAVPLGTPLALDDLSLPLRPDASELYVANADGTGLRRLVAGAEDAALNPNGAQVAIASPEGRQTALALLDLQTNDVKEALRADGDIRLAGWSQDGSWLALDRWDPQVLSSWVELYELRSGVVSRVPVDGPDFVDWSPGGDALLVRAGTPAPPGSGVTLYRVDVPSLRSETIAQASDFRYIAYSPDGEWIAAVEAVDEGTSTRMRLTVLRPDGSDRRDLFSTTDQTNLGVVSWTPDSRRVAFSLDSYVSREGIGVHVADVEGRETMTLTRPDEGFDSPVAWSPDGERLLVARVDCIGCEPGSHKLLLVSVEDSSETLLTETGEYSQPSASWSPDGTRLVYAGEAVFLASADGSNPQRVGEWPAAGFRRAEWSADGRQVLFVRSYLPFATFSSEPDGSDPRFLGPQVVSVASNEQAWVQRIESGALVRWLDEGTEVSVEGYVTDAVWAPSGAAVVLQRAGPPPMEPLALVGQDGDTRMIGSASAGGPRWSPDSRELAYWADGAIWVVGVLDGAPRRLIAVQSCCAFDWSPDGAEIAVADGADVFAVQVDGSAQRELFTLDPSLFNSYALRWSPSSDKIAVTGSGGLVIGSPATANVQAFADRADGGIVWSPAGDALAFGVNESKSLVPGVYVVDAENGDIAQLTEVTGFNHGVRDWLADGRIVFWTYSIT